MAVSFQSPSILITFFIKKPVDPMCGAIEKSSGNPGLVTDDTLTDEAFRAKANTLLHADQSSTLRSRAADVREILSRNARRIRSLVQRLPETRTGATAAAPRHSRTLPSHR